MSIIVKGSGYGRGAKLMLGQGPHKAKYDVKRTDYVDGAREGAMVR